LDFFSCCLQDFLASSCLIVYLWLDDTDTTVSLFHSGEPSVRFKAFMNHVVKSGSLAEKYSAVRHESDTVGGGDIMDLN
jgi:hypothetical protein